MKQSNSTTFMNHNINDPLPKIYITSMNAIRGLDLPHLYHIYLLADVSILSKLNHSYIHLAGRVARTNHQKKGYANIVTDQSNKKEQYYLEKMMKTYSHLTFFYNVAKKNKKNPKK